MHTNAHQRVVRPKLGRLKARKGIGRDPLLLDIYLPRYLFKEQDLRDQSTSRFDLTLWAAVCNPLLSWLS